MTPAEASKEAARAKREALEAAMLQQLRAAKLTEGMVQQYRPFEQREFRFDFAWPKRRPGLLLEVEGGIWSGGAHARGAGITRDILKANMAALAGYVTLRATADHVKSGEALMWVEAALRGLCRA